MDPWVALYFFSFEHSLNFCWSSNKRKFCKIKKKKKWSSFKIILSFKIQNFLLSYLFFKLSMDNFFNNFLQMMLFIFLPIKLHKEESNFIWLIVRIFAHQVEHKKENILKGS